MEQGGSWSGRERNCAYLNLGDGRFANVSAVTGADYLDDSRAVVHLDWDGDGDQDLVVKGRTAPRLRFLRNEDASGNHHIEVRLVGKGMNRDAIGALVAVQAGGKLFTKRLYAGDGYLSQSSKTLHFGLGQAQSIEKLSVTWPDQSVEVFDELKIDGRVQLVQGEGALKLLEVPIAPEYSDANSGVVTRAEGSVRRIPLVNKLPMSAVHIPAFDNPNRRVVDLAGGPVLINLWASWCQNCIVELREFQKHEDELLATGLQIITMTTDAEDQYPAAKKLLERYGFTAGSGYVDPALQVTLEILIVEILGRPDNVSVPASLLIDANGQAVVLYNGPVEVKTLLADIETLSHMDPLIPSSAELFGGIWGKSRQRAFRKLARAFKRGGHEELRTYYLDLALTRRALQDEAKDETEDETEDETKDDR
ncbi:MAG: peroxiredoxin [Planctomycetota bacterium]|jgi:peroxiredoxin